MGQNDPNYQTKNSKVLSFNDFEINVRKEKEELKKLDRSFTNNDSEIHQVPNNTVQKYNRVTNKLDDLSRAQVKDKIQAIEDDGVEDVKHKYKAEIPTQQSSPEAESNESIMTATEFFKRK